MAQPTQTFNLGLGPITCHAWNKDRSRKFIYNILSSWRVYLNIFIILALFKFRFHCFYFNFSIGLITKQSRSTYLRVESRKMGEDAHFGGTRFAHHRHWLGSKHESNRHLLTGWWCGLLTDLSTDWLTSITLCDSIITKDLDFRIKMPSCGLLMAKYGSRNWFSFDCNWPRPVSNGLLKVAYYFGIWGNCGCGNCKWPTYI